MSDKIDVADLAECMKRAIFDADHFEGRVSAASALTVTAALPALLRVLKAAQAFVEADDRDSFCLELSQQIEPFNQLKDAMGDALSAFDFGGDDE